MILRALSLYSNKIGHLPIDERQDIIQTFLGSPRDSAGKTIGSYSNLFIQESTPEISIDSIHSNIRAYYFFLKEGGQILSEYEATDGAINLDTYQGGCKLSELVQTKKLRDRDMMGFGGNTEALQRFVESTVDGKDNEVILRDIAHSINHQVVNDSNLWMRELVQNSLDAVQKAKLISAEERQVSVSSYYRKRKMVIPEDEVWSCFGTHVGLAYAKYVDHFKRLVQEQLVGDEVLSAKSIVDALRNCKSDDGESYFSGMRLKLLEKDLNELFVEKKDMIVAVNDPVGMTLQEVVNYLLVPGESSKRDDESQFGVFGQGFFTIFQGAKEVHIKTSTGNGTVTYLRIAPLLNEGGKTIDLDVEWAQSQEDFKGTSIQKVVDTDFPELEAAFCKNSIITYGGLVDANAIAINYGDTQINAPRSVLAEAEHPELGRIRIYDAPENAVTQNGLLVKPLDHEYLVGVPDDIRKIIVKEGVVVDLPPGIRLIKSRCDIAKKKDVLPKLQEVLPGLILQAYLQKFRKRSIEMENLPYDYFDVLGAGALRKHSITNEIVSDANTINDGGLLAPESLTRYQSNSEDLIKLLTLIRAIEIKGERKSLFEIAQMIEAGEELDMEGMPNQLRQRINRSKSQHKEDFEYQKAAEVELGEKKKELLLDKPLKEDPELMRQMDALYAFDMLRREIDVRMSAHDINRMYYMKAEGAVAHANKAGSSIGWNLFHLRGKMETLSKIIKGESTEEETLRFMESLISIETHERQHNIERSDAWTHNEDFYKGQRRILTRMLRSGTFDTQTLLAPIRERFPDFQGKVPTLKEMIVALS